MGKTLDIKERVVLYRRWQQCEKENRTETTNNETLIRRTAIQIVYATLISANIFILVSVLTILISQEYRVNFKVGFPWTYYYQFLIDDYVQHGFIGDKFLKDTFLTWILTIFVWFGLKRKKTLLPTKNKANAAITSSADHDV